ncbi:TorF family putative porin [Massilia cavernae]|uniref:Uncharacterized protein n=1 Tax=Massilia cavernae TaxID=2320864 RepID=A0A418Y470_9BURK|nr:TorF family putative porin [Massilia cavernae]RJG20342.1 hypothetical protein D3872_08585 [Massilia cavernae]
MKNLNPRLSIAAVLGLVAATSGAPAAYAQSTDSEVSFNVAVTTDYRYRGLSQTRKKPALQGGADYVNKASGFYVGTWLSTIKWIKDFGGDSDIEWDIYAGKRGDIAEGISYDIGGLGYVYPDNSLNPSANTFELYGQVGMGPGYIKYSHSTTNLFGTADSKGSGYLDIGANVELSGGMVLNLHAGRQRVANNGVFSYNDFKLGVTKDFGFATVALAAISADTDAYTSPVNGKDLAKTGAVLTISKTF